ncbi:MAG TPA: nucleotidyltransferase family protein [Coriobacteriia bacterium]
MAPDPRSGHRRAEFYLLDHAHTAALIACALDASDPRMEADLREALARTTDWDGLANTALRHGMAGILYRRVAGTCPDAVPTAVLESWRARSAHVAVRSLRMQRALVALLDALAAAGVPALTFKGAAISEQLYGDSTVRYFTDLDVLVRPASVPAARNVAIALGYEDVHPFEDVGASFEGILEGEQEIALVHPVSGLLVEVHWRIGPRFAEDSLLADELFERAGSVGILGRQVECLGPWDTALALAVHAGTHEWGRLEDVAALCAALTNVDDAEASGLEALASASGCVRRLHIGVLLVATLTQAPLPSSLELAARSDRTARRLANVATARLVASLADSADFDHDSPLKRVRRTLWEARSLDSRRATVHYAWRRLLVPVVIDRPEMPASAEGALGALMTQVRRQRRLWRRR